jgi:hypothetical protein
MEQAGVHSQLAWQGVYTNRKSRYVAMK